MPDGVVPFENLWAVLILSFHIQPSEAWSMELSDVWLLLAKSSESRHKPAMSVDEFKNMRKALNL